MEGMAGIAIQIQAEFGLHAVDGGVVAFFAHGLRRGLGGPGKGALSVGLAVADHAFDQHHPVFTLVPVLGDFWRGFAMAGVTIRGLLGGFQVFDRLAS
ncbi:MAG: hypothetical protein MI749_22695, partial [Desulfovibrionales bacterium]|nr:hypothetical protein [Desulfovibrionales bacterium]